MRLVRKQEMAGAIIIGALVGIVGFIPLLGSLRVIRRAPSTGIIGHAGALLLGVLVSSVIIFAAAFLCIVLARSLVLPFVLAEVIALSLAAVVFGFSKLVWK